MTRQYRSGVMASIHETAEGLHAAGTIDERAMRIFDEACLDPIPPLTSTQGRVLRDRDQ